jgi:hypothetical protein
LISRYRELGLIMEQEWQVLDIERGLSQDAPKRDALSRVDHPYSEGFHTVGTDSQCLGLD